MVHQSPPDPAAPNSTDAADAAGETDANKSSGRLLALRAELTRLDDELVHLIAARMRVVGEVGRLKSEEGLAPFDRVREASKLEELAALADALAVPRELVNDVFGTLLANSRATQRTLMLTAEPRVSIGIIGGTRGMGAFLARAFGHAGYPVTVMGLDGGPPAEEVAASHDVVIVAVPISVTERVIGQVAPRVRKGACLMDVTSVKKAPLAAMLSSAPPEVDVVGTHPMFGPPAGNDMDRQRVVLCRGRGEIGYARVRRLFEQFGADIIEADAAEHDAQMALIQLLVHEKTMVLGSVLERLGAPLGRSLEFASPIYRAELAMVGRLYSQEADLYADILTNNADGARVSALFAKEACRFALAVENGERTWILGRFREVANYLKEFAAWAKKESDAILHDVVRHG